MVEVLRVWATEAACSLLLCEVKVGRLNIHEQLSEFLFELDCELVMKLSLSVLLVNRSDWHASKSSAM